MSDINRSKDFRYIYANSVKLQFNGSELMLGIGVKENQAESDNDFYEEVTIILSAASAKLWGQMISRVISSSEKATGVQIDIDDTKLENLNEILEKAEESMKNKKK